MNEVEAYLRKTGKWNTVPIDTDWRGRARSGPWWPQYYAQWLDVHGADREKTELNPGTWTRDHDLHEVWISTTPEWDRQWFEAHSVKPPKRFGDPARTYWKDYGDGLRGLSYR